MTVLQALNRYYDRMAVRGEVEPPGFSREKVSFAIELSSDGAAVSVRDLRTQSGKRLVPALLAVPSAVRRTVGILPNLLWDKSAYVLGRTAGAGRRTAQEHAAFKAANLELLAGANDAGLVALRSFLEQWTPERFDKLPFVSDMLDTNIVFRLEGEHAYIHDREPAKRLLAGRGESGTHALCLVTGKVAPVQRLHPSIKGVDGAQSSGAALVSFNLDAFTSYGKEQGDNAPTSETAAFRYGAALNRLLDRTTSRNRIRIGDATVAFWADASRVGEEAASAAENVMAAWFAPSPAEGDHQDAAEAVKLRDALDQVRAGRPVADLDLGLKEGTRIYVLGLAPNAARLSIRYWLEEDFSAFARRLADHYDDLAIDPAPWRSTLPSIQRLLVKTTALQEKFENIPPLLAGEVTRAVLTGSRYPSGMLVAAIVRLRAGDDPASGWHAAAIKASLARDHRLNLSKEGAPVSLERDNRSPAYQLGRLFAAVETAQRLALGKLNATIRDRYFGAASATPASVFPLLLRGAQNHLGKLRKEGKGAWLEREIEEISSRLGSEFPRSLPLQAQGRFVLGYYHQRKGQFGDREAQAEIANVEAKESSDDEA